jgi:N-acetylglucosamine-6-phosphate deacetylase
MIAGSFMPCDLVCDGQVISEINPSECSSAINPPVHRAFDSHHEIIDAEGRRVLPGFIDLQINGVEGIDLTETPERLFDVARILPKYGVTSFLPTLVTSDVSHRARALGAWREFKSLVSDSGFGAGLADPIGWHFEGPFLSREKMGVHEASFRSDPTLAAISTWSRENGVALVTIAPELPDASQIIRTLSSRDVCVFAGHTNATAEEFLVAVANGVTGVTHIFNAMRPLGHRDPGPIGVVLNGPPVHRNLFATLICDGVHVDPLVVGLVAKLLGPDRLTLVSDAAAPTAASRSGLATAAGSAWSIPRGSSTSENSEFFSLGNARVRIEDGALRRHDRTLAGSIVMLPTAIQNLTKFAGWTYANAVRTVTSTPADALGVQDRGAIAIGKRADFVLLSDDNEVQGTVIAGRVAHRSVNGPLA